MVTLSEVFPGRLSPGADQGTDAVGQRRSSRFTSQSRGFGRAMWIRRHYGIFEFDIEPGLYAMVGAAATLAGVCRVTISLVVIMCPGGTKGLEYTRVVFRTFGSFRH